MKEHIFQPPQELFQSPQELCPRLPHALPSSSVLPADTSNHSQASLGICCSQMLATNKQSEAEAPAWLRAAQGVGQDHPCPG